MASGDQLRPVLAEYDFMAVPGLHWLGKDAHSNRLANAHSHEISRVSDGHFFLWRPVTAGDNLGRPSPVSDGHLRPSLSLRVQEKFSNLER
jgi:hypothetical protein